jgi:5-methylcytosine-specific restriction endonuclease McrA
VIESDRETHAKAMSYLESSIAALDEKLGEDRDWIRCKRLIRRTIKIIDYPWQWLPLLPYAEYLTTDHWQRQRKRALEEADGKCKVCNSGGELHVHHRTYENLGNERTTDLVVLCKRCHSLFHEHCQLAEKDGLSS